MKKIITIIVILTTLVGFLIYKNNFVAKETSEDEVSIVMNSIVFSLNKTSNNFEYPAKIDSNYHLIWLTNDGYNIFVPSTPGIKLNAILNTPNQNEDVEVLIKDVETYNAIFKNELESRGFKLNKLNSSLGEDFDRQGRYLQAYEKSDIRCLSSTKQRPVTNSETNIKYIILEFSCATDKKIQENYNLQKPFFDVLEKETNAKRENIYIWGLEVNEDTARTSVSSFYSGYGAFFYNSENGWRLISAGQAQPYCSELQEREVPKKYWDCIE